MTPPVAPKIPRESTRHGETVVDDYFWLRQKDDPEVTAYLAAENAYAEGIVAGTGDLQERLYREMLGRIKETDLSVPYRKGRYWYYARTEEGRQYPILARKLGSLSSAEEVILDLNSLARDHAYFAVDSFSVSDDGDWLAYSVDTAGSREYTLRLRDLRRSEDDAETIPRVSSVAWATGGETLFYVTDDDAKRPYRLWRLDRRTKASTLLFEENDERFSFTVRRSRSQSYLFLDVDSHTASEVRFLRADDPSGDWTLALPRATDIEYEIEHGDDVFWIRINDRGRNFRVVQCPPDDVRPEAWREVIAHRPEVHVAAVEPFRGWLVVYEREDGLERYVLRNLATGTSHAVAFPEPTYTTFPDINAEYETTRFRFRYQSLTTPPSVFEYDLETRERTLLKKMEVLGSFDPDRYATERRHAVSGDGTRVPISIVYRKDTPRNGTAPLHIVGYGAYGYPLPVMFSSNRLSLLDRGVVCALVHVRGGGELGQPWHDAGRMASKTSSFADFIAGADELIARGYGARERTIVEGASAGGLLIGAVLNARPDLAGGAILKVPFVDVINTMLDPSLPLTVGEFEEWGNPAEPAHYAIMRAYCPYTNLARRPYPAMLVKTSMHDSQVMYWEPAKYVARLRALNDGAPQVALRVNFGAGHGGSSGRYDALKDTAFDVAWMVRTWGIAA
ncbi:MAG TPA: S9 family peptidase [Candidatus Polarisedimenticolaceae bacterium]|nr:S9 family peptidase [Candidatus Polarisedimenticolaceae bacterium]